MMSKNILITAMVLLLSWQLIVQAANYPHVDDIAAYSGNEYFVYDNLTSAWYALNNEGTYERWGIVELVDDLSEATYYDGKYSRCGTIIYKYHNGWEQTVIVVEPAQKPANGIYVSDGGGNLYDMSHWDVGDNYKAQGVVLVTNNMEVMVSMNDVFGAERHHLEYTGLSTDHAIVWGENGLVDGVATTQANYSNMIPGDVVLSDFAGRNNTLLINSNLNNPDESAVSLAFHYRFANGAGGYLPALGELLELKKSLNSVNAAIEMAGGAPVNGFYWTSSQHYLNYRAWTAPLGTPYVVNSTDIEYFAQLRNNHTPLQSSYPDACYFMLRVFGPLPDYVFEYPYPESPEGEAMQYRIGDVNGDGEVNIDDLNILINIMLKKDSADNYDGRACIVHEDFTDVADLNALIDILLGRPVDARRAIIVSDELLSFDGEVGNIYAQTLTVTGDNLMENVAAEIIGGDGAFSVSPSILELSAIRQGGTLTVEYTPTAAGLQTATLQLISAEADMVEVTLTGNATAPNSSTKTYTVNGVSFTMVTVEGGTFTMGATAEQGSDYDSDELPTHLVTLSNFSIAETEVTQELWQAVMGSNPSYYTGNLQRPVERVNWNDCQTFITKLNQLTGQDFRLPTEAEWEFAARGGNKSKGYKYAGSNDINEVAWYYTSQTNYMTRPVATKAPNELGLYDMSGNVSEWCGDWYSGYNSAAQMNPTGPATGTTRVSRGGNLGDFTHYCRVSERRNDTPSHSGSYMGLRLAMGELPGQSQDNASLCQRDGFTQLSTISSADFNTLRSKFRTVRLDLPLGTTNGHYVSVILKNLTTGATDWRSNRIQTRSKSVGGQIRDNSSTDRDITVVGSMVDGSNDLWEYTFSSDMEIFSIDGNVVKDMVWLKIEE